MKIEVWLDFTCPFCYLAKKRLENAINDFQFGSNVEVEYKSYLINPLVTKTLAIDAHQSLAVHKDISYEEAKLIHTKIALMGFEDGIIMNFGEVKPTTSKCAHKLSKLIKDNEKKAAFIDDIYKAYFELGEDISDYKVLLKYMKKIDFTENQIKEAYQSDRYLTDIKYDNDESVSYGITGVPFFVIDQTFSLSGAQKKEAFDEMLQQVYYANIQAVKEKHSKTEFCTGDDCDYVPKVKEHL